MRNAEKAKIEHHHCSSKDADCNGEPGHFCGPAIVVSLGIVVFVG
jgi:hypothetical protein